MPFHDPNVISFRGAFHPIFTHTVVILFFFNHFRRPKADSKNCVIKHYIITWKFALTNLFITKSFKSHSGLAISLLTARSLWFDFRVRQYPCLCGLPLGMPVFFAQSKDMQSDCLVILKLFSVCIYPVTDWWPVEVFRIYTQCVSHRDPKFNKALVKKLFEYTK